MLVAALWRVAMMLAVHGPTRPPTSTLPTLVREFVSLAAWCVRHIQIRQCLAIAPAGVWSGSDVANTYSDGKAWYSVPGPLEAKHPLPDNQTADHAVETLKALAEKHVAGAKPWFVAVGFHKPHLPFVASEQFFDDFYPASEIELPPNQQPPEGMPPVAWSSYGEIRAYSDIKALNATGAPGTVLPKQDVLELRRAYYASVTQTDFMLGKVMSELKSGPFASNTVVSIWGDHGWQLVCNLDCIATTHFDLQSQTLNQCVYSGRAWRMV